MVVRFQVAGLSLSRVERLAEMERREALWYQRNILALAILHHLAASRIRPSLLEANARHISVAHLSSHLSSSRVPSIFFTSHKQCHLSLNGHTPLGEARTHLGGQSEKRYRESINSPELCPHLSFSSSCRNSRTGRYSTPATCTQAGSNCRPTARYPKSERLPHIHVVLVAQIALGPLREFLLPDFFESHHRRRRNAACSGPEQRFQRRLHVGCRDAH